MYKKVSSCSIAQFFGLLKAYSLAGMFNRTPSQYLWEACELEQCRMKHLGQGLRRQHRVHFPVLLVESLKLCLLWHCWANFVLFLPSLSSGMRLAMVTIVFFVVFSVLTCFSLHSLSTVSNSFYLLLLFSILLPLFPDLY